MKIAVAMRLEGFTDETMVIDRAVCGTRSFDQNRDFTCDHYLSRILAPGSRLRVVQPDGIIREYKGKAQP